MLRVVSGTFHPTLEDTLIQSLQRFKQNDPFLPLLIVVPSLPLQQHLKWVACQERGLSLLNVRIVTFHQLSSLILQETGSHQRLCSELFFGEMIHALLRRCRDELGEWERFIDMPGAWMSLWATVRNLKNGGLEAIRSAEFFREEVEGSRRHLHDSDLRNVLRFAANVLAEKERVQAYDHDDLMALALPHIPQSTLLARVAQVWFYGLYDLNQLQIDLFQAIARSFESVLYFPFLKDHPAFHYAQPFYERFIQGYAVFSHDGTNDEQEMDGSVPDLPEERERILPPRKGGRLPFLFQGQDPGLSDGSPATLFQPALSLNIVTVAGVTDEVSFVAKDILRLIEEEGYAFHEIAVVGRTLNEYEMVIPRIFFQQALPFCSSLSRPLIDFPFVQTLLHVFEVRTGGFLRSHVIDLLSSPFLRLSHLCPEMANPQPELWDALSRQFGIRSGLDQWRLLKVVSDQALVAGKDTQQRRTPEWMNPEVIRGLWEAVAALHSILEPIPEEAGWDDYVHCAKGLIEEYLDPFVDRPQAHGDGDMRERFFTGWHEVLCRTLDEVADLSCLDSQPTFAEFVETLRRTFEHTSVPMGNEDGKWAKDGVRVLDAMEARGVRFRALYVLGLNDQCFPRSIHEDPFLHDQARRRLDVDWGLTIREQAAGREEEKLLFYLLANSAEALLTLCYQRTNSAGQDLVPSVFLDELTKQYPTVSPLIVPRRLTEKFAQISSYGMSSLTTSEFCLQGLLERRMSPRLLESLHPQGAMIVNGITALCEQENDRAVLGPFDGVIGSDPEAVKRLWTNGFSPTAFERYARCPFQFFAGSLLRLTDIPNPSDREPVGPVEWGNMVHQILCRCMTTLFLSHDRSAPQTSPLLPHQALEDAARRIFEEFASSHSVGYSLEWAWHCETMVKFLDQVLVEELSDLSEEWKPVLVEEHLKGFLPGIRVKGHGLIPISGHVDRVDWSDTRKTFRIVDYKLKMSTQLNSSDKNLVMAAARGEHFQPPLYAALGQQTLAEHCQDLFTEQSPHCEGVQFHYLLPHRRNQNEPAVSRKSFPGDAWTSSLRSCIAHAVSVVVEGIQSGHFFIFPGPYCANCAYRTVCRRTYLPALSRIRQDKERVEAIRRLRRVTVPHTTSTGKVNKPVKQQSRRKREGDG